MSGLPKCPQCGSEFAYEDGTMYVCPECAHEWSKEAAAATDEVRVIRDSNGNVLADGDTVTVIKDLGEEHPPCRGRPRHRLQDRWRRGDAAEVGVREEGLALSSLAQLGKRDCGPVFILFRSHAPYMAPVGCSGRQV